MAKQNNTKVVTGIVRLSGSMMLFSVSVAPVGQT